MSMQILKLYRKNTIQYFTCHLHNLHLPIHLDNHSFFNLLRFFFYFLYKCIQIRAILYLKLRLHIMYLFCLFFCRYIFYGVLLCSWEVSFFFFYFTDVCHSTNRFSMIYLAGHLLMDTCFNSVAVMSNAAMTIFLYICMSFHTVQLNLEYEFPGTNCCDKLSCSSKFEKQITGNLK